MKSSPRRLRFVEKEDPASASEPVRAVAEAHGLELGEWVEQSPQVWSALIRSEYSRGDVEFWTSVREQGWDLAVTEDLDPTVPGVIAFDADSTLVLGEGIDDLASRAGVAAEVAAITDRAMAGELDYAASLRARVALLRGLGATDLAAVAAAIKLRPGARRCVEIFRALKWRILVVSGGFDFYLEEIARRLRVDAVVGNRLSVRDGVLSGEVEGPIVGAREKAEALRAELRRSGRRLGIAVGDGANDRELMAAAGVAIGVLPRPALFPVLDGVVGRGGLEVVPTLSGLPLHAEIDAD